MSAAKALLDMLARGWIQRAGPGRPCPYNRTAAYPVESTPATVADRYTAFRGAISDPASLTDDNHVTIRQAEAP